MMKDENKIRGLPRIFLRGGVIATATAAAKPFRAEGAPE